jgi:CheY-like chemotaxis protein
MSNRQNVWEGRIVSVLIVDPNKEFRDAACKLVKWADGRRSIEVATDGTTGRDIALSFEPDLIICELDLPDMAGDTLCRQLRSKLPQTTFVAYTDDLKANESTQESVFDGILNKPPRRIAVLSYLNVAREYKKKMQHRMNSDNILVEDNVRDSFWSRRPKDITNQFDIFISLADESQLKFSVPVPEGSTIGAVLQQIGKSRVTWFALNRNGAEIEGTVDTDVRPGDVLFLRT